MSNLKIEIFTDSIHRPTKTVRISIDNLKSKMGLVPLEVRSLLEEGGIDLDEIVRISETGDAWDQLVEVEDDVKKKRVVISLE